MTDKYILDHVTHEAIPADDLITWARWYESADRRVALTEVGPYHVSTVFLGLDHQYGTGPPLLFETMVWMDTCAAPDSDMHTWLDEQERCSTWDEAVAQHERMCELMRTDPRYGGAGDAHTP